MTRPLGVRALAVAGMVAASMALVAFRTEAAPAYVGRVAAAQASPLLPTSSVTLTTGQQVAAGNALLISLKVSTSLVGGMGASDAAGNAYHVDIDQTDGSGLGHTILISAANVRPLSTGASITVTFPTSTSYMVSVDQFSGLSGLDVISSQSGSSSTFSSGSASTSQPGELLIGTVGIEGGASPAWASGWNALPTLTLGGDRLGVAYLVTSSAGSYAASGSTSGTWMAGLGAYAPVIPPDNPPVARLAVSQLSSPALTVRADGSGSTDTDSTPIASYRFDFGDGTAAVTTTAPTATAQHSYAAAGSYTVTLIATDTGGHASSPTSATINVTPPSTSAQVAVYAGYYDTHHSYYLKQKPSPWQGASNVIFVGSPDGGTTNGWDTSALRVDNLSSGTISVNATVDIGTHHFALWSPQNVPAGGTVILAQTALENFDGSDTNPAGCYGCNPDLCTTMVSHTVPVVNLSVNGTTTTYSDPDQVLNTGGVDAAGCPATGTRNDESHSWTPIQPNATGTSAHAQQSGDRATGFQAAANLGIPVPNPARDNLMIRFSVLTPGAVRVGVYDIAGRLAAPGTDGELEAGDYNLQINLSDKPAGIYIVRLSTASGTAQRKFTHVR